jgi:hypothetical protein
VALVHCLVLGFSAGERRISLTLPLAPELYRNGGFSDSVGSSVSVSVRASDQ